MHKNTTQITSPWRQYFPCLAQTVRANKPLVYLDSAASSQQSEQVLATVDTYQRLQHSNVHRGVHALSEKATAEYEGARDIIYKYIGAARREEIIFTSGATAAINLVARSYGMQNLQAGDEIIVSSLEHHANLVPWQMLAQQTGAVIKVIPLLENGDLDLEAYHKLLNTRTRLLALTHMSNVLGTINPVQQMIAAAQAYGAKVLLDGCQAIAHAPVDVQALDCDFYVFSGHKVYAPTGIGVLYAKYDLLEAMPPLFGGGDMIRTVSFEKSTYAPAPYKFEAGTPPIAAAIGLGAALLQLQAWGLPAIHAHESALLSYANRQLAALDGVRLLAKPACQGGVISFLIDDVHPHDVGTILDRAGVAVRVGHHCAMPLMGLLQCPATVRASFGLYSQATDVDALLLGLRQVQQIFV